MCPQLANYTPPARAWRRPPGTGKTSLCQALAQKLTIRLSSRWGLHAGPAGGAGAQQAALQGEPSEGASAWLYEGCACVSQVLHRVAPQVQSGRAHRGERAQPVQQVVQRERQARGAAVCKDPGALRRGPWAVGMPQGAQTLPTQASKRTCAASVSSLPVLPPGKPFSLLNPRVCRRWWMSRTHLCLC